MISMSEINSSIENYKVDIDVNSTKKLTVINPNSFPNEDTNNDPGPSIMRTVGSNKFSVRNMLYDENVWFEEATSEDIKNAGKIEGEQEDNYHDELYRKILEKNLKNITPPEPPTEEILSETSHDNKFYTKQYYEFRHKIGDGKFEYITNIFERVMLVNAWQSITLTNNWDFMAQDIYSFMWSKDPRIDDISKKMQELGYYDHSGASFGCTLRNMQYLAQNGEEKLKQLFHITENEDEDKVFPDIDPELEPYAHEDAMEYEQRLKELIKRTVDKQKGESKLMEYMGGY